MYNSGGNISDFARTKVKRANLRCNDTSDTIPCTANSDLFFYINLKEVIGMLKKQDNMRIVSWYCPNCGQLISAFPNGEGKVKISCCKCKTRMVLNNKGRRHDTLDLFAAQ